MKRLVVYQCKECGHQYVPRKNRKVVEKYCPWCHSKEVFSLEMKEAK